MRTLERIRAAAACVLLALALLPAAAQLPGRAPASAPAASAPAAGDPLDRDTPRRAIAAFARAVQRGDLALAVRYAQVQGRSQARAEQMVREVAQALDRHYRLPMASISDAPEGSLVDGLPLDREHVGPLRMGGEDQSIELVRVTDPTSGPIWLISSESLARIAALREEGSLSWPERLLPHALFTRALFDFTFADIVVWAASLALPLLLLPPLLRLVRLAACKLFPRHAGAIDAWYAGTRAPAVLLVALGCNAAALPDFGPTLIFRAVYSRVMALAVVAVLAWGLLRVFSVFFARAGMHLRDRGETAARSALLLGERVLKVVILLFAVLGVLAILGFDMKTVLAGLGIVGVALALGAQKTIENILGGMMLLGDAAIAVGDLCRVNNRLCTVEDITLRSVRFRTLENTLLSIPAGVLAQADLENFATRDKILAHHRLRLAYDTSPGQLRRIREELAALVEAHPELEHPLSRVRLVEFGPLGMELEIYAYVLTRDVPTFLAVREELLLRAIASVDAAGARFAPPAAWAAPPAPAGPTEPPR